MYDMERYKLDLYSLYLGFYSLSATISVADKKGLSSFETVILFS